jgi:hypothetical protein
MGKYFILGPLLGLVFTAWFGYSLYTGSVDVNLSGMHMDYTTITRENQPGKYWAAMGGIAFVIVVYWTVMVWFLRHLKKAKAKQSATAN